MVTLNPPFIELGYYLLNSLDADSLELAYRALIQHGISFGGAMKIARGQGIRSQPFAFKTDYLTSWENQISELELIGALDSPDVKVVEILCKDAMDGELVPMILTYNGSSQPTRTHSLSVQTDGTIFSCIDPADRVNVQIQRGEYYYRLFLSITKLLQPLYSSITIEYPLESLDDLKTDPRSMAFCNFFVNSGLIGSRKTMTIAQEMSSAYVESLRGGVYYSVQFPFNPAGIHLDSELALQKSVSVATIIGN